MKFPKMILSFLMLTIMLTGCTNNNLDNTSKKNKLDTNIISSIQNKNTNNTISDTLNNSNIDTLSIDAAKKIIENLAKNPNGNNGTVEYIPAFDKNLNGIQYYYFNVTYASGPASQYFVNSVNGNIYESDYNKDIMINGSPVNKKSALPDTAKNNHSTLEWKFGNKDISINGNKVLDFTYKQINETFGENHKVKILKVRPPSSLPDEYENMLIASYRNIEFEFHPSSEIKSRPLDTDKVFRFDITKDDIKLDCGLRVGMTIAEVKNKFGDRVIHLLNDSKESASLNDIKNILITQTSHIKNVL